MGEAGNATLGTARSADQVRLHLRGHLPAGKQSSRPHRWRCLKRAKQCQLVACLFQSSSEPICRFGLAAVVGLPVRETAFVLELDVEAASGEQLNTRSQARGDVAVIETGAESAGAGRYGSKAGLAVEAVAVEEARTRAGVQVKSTAAARIEARAKLQPRGYRQYPVVRVANAEIERRVAVLVVAVERQIVDIELKCRFEINSRSGQPVSDVRVQSGVDRVRIRFRHGIAASGEGAFREKTSGYATFKPETQRKTLSSRRNQRQRHIDVATQVLTGNNSTFRK